MFFINKRNELTTWENFSDIFGTDFFGHRYTNSRHTTNQFTYRHAEDGKYIYEALVPGLSKDELKITVKNGLMTIEGEGKKGKIKFETTLFELPSEVKAECKDGILTITVTPEVKEIEVVIE